MRIFLVLACCVVSILSGLLLARGGKSSETIPRNRAPLIGLSLDTLKEERWQADRDLFEKRIRSLGGELLVQSANSDDTRQIADVQALISRRVDVLVIVPHNGAAMAKAVALAHEAGIPVLSYDRLITGCELDLYMTFDNIKVGELQAQYLVEKLPNARSGSSGSTAQKPITTRFCSNRVRTTSSSLLSRRAKSRSSTRTGRRIGALRTPKRSPTPP